MYLNNPLRIFFILWAGLQIEAKRDLTIEINQFITNVTDWQLVKTANYYLYGTKTIFVDFVLSRNVNNFQLKVSVDMIRKDNRHMNVFKIDTSGCEALKGTHDKMNLMRVVFREIFRVSNIPKKCPIIGNQKYVINNYTLRGTDFPSFFPNLEFQIKIEFTVDNIPTATAIIKGTIRK
ncbi:uncharacterized protein [Musca autumnalis]|uniref:uncharacterized protein n=1 Tax=Musca autumnalis TaxID=221902 RepID=UPI003CEF6A8B